MTLQVGYLPRAQKRAYTCGPTALANALALLGLPISQEAAQGACGSGVEGADGPNMCKGIRVLGFFPIVRSVRKKADFDKLLAWVARETTAGRFVICSINGNQAEGHWILLMRVLPRGVHVWDPNAGFSKIVTKRNLYRAWWNEGAADEGVPDDAWCVSLAPRTKHAKRAVAIRKNLLAPPRGPDLPVKK